MGFDEEEADTEPQRPRPAKANREVPKQSAALIIHDPGDGQVKLELVYPDGTTDDNVPLSARIAQHAMEYITSLSQGDE